ncbi:hypothetical protein LguiA_001862 [Lonicera macranthoides]
MINSPYHGIYRSPPYMPKPSKSRFNHLFCNRCHPNSLSDGNIPDLIFPSLATHPSQHSHLSYT